MVYLRSISASNNVAGACECFSDQLTKIKEWTAPLRDILTVWSVSILIRYSVLWFALWPGPQQRGSWCIKNDCSKGRCAIVYQTKASISVGMKFIILYVRDHFINVAMCVRIPAHNLTINIKSTGILTWNISSNVG